MGFVDGLVVGVERDIEGDLHFGKRSKLVETEGEIVETRSSILETRSSIFSVRYLLGLPMERGVRRPVSVGV